VRSEGQRWGSKVRCGVGEVGEQGGEGQREVEHTHESQVDSEAWCRVAQVHDGKVGPITPND
jgi:hypothetical protein